LGLKCFNSIYGVKTTESLFRLNAAIAVEFSYWKLWYSVMSESISQPRPCLQRDVSQNYLWLLRIDQKEKKEKINQK